eukprot:m.207405 g.207405  ORF g.207405 m.207405 type:complete len:84 (-) comp18926_c0_seq8:910-1161(-)
MDLCASGLCGSAFARRDCRVTSCDRALLLQGSVIGNGTHEELRCPIVRIFVGRKCISHRLRHWKMLRAKRFNPTLTKNDLVES